VAAKKCTAYAPDPARGLQSSQTGLKGPISKEREGMKNGRVGKGERGGEEKDVKRAR